MYDYEIMEYVSISLARMEILCSLCNDELFSFKSEVVFAKGLCINYVITFGGRGTL